MLVFGKNTVERQRSGPCPQENWAEAGSIHVTTTPSTPSPSDTAEDLLERQQAKLWCQIQGRSPGGGIVGGAQSPKDRVTQLPQTARCMSWVQCENFFALRSEPRTPVLCV